MGNQNLSELSEEELIDEIHLLRGQNQKLKEAANNSKEMELKFRLLFDTSDDAILVIEDNVFVDCNQAVVRMLGYETKEDLLNTHPSELSPEYQPDGRPSFEKAQEMMELAIKNGSHHFEWMHTRANGEYFPVEVWLSTVNYKGKLLINTIWRDLTEIKIAEDKIKASLREKEVLLREIHHRVKNNMQIITSLLSLQSGLMDNDVVKGHFRQCQFRINSMAMIHEMLYQSDNFSEINYAEYVKQLVTELITSIKGVKNDVEFKFSSPELYLSIDTAIPLGLLINEIITNSLKYGITNEVGGKIEIQFTREDSANYTLLIGDNGVGIPNGVTVENSSSLGLKLIYRLARQLGGNISLIPDKQGTHYKLVFCKSE